MSKPSQVIVLAEDRTQQRLAYWYLRRLGINRNLIRSERLPAGKGSGEQQVRQLYAANVKAYRTESARVDKAFVVMIDADAGPVKRRFDQLTRQLKDAGLPPVRANERIAHLIPKRNIETWILCLNKQLVRGHLVNEDDDYKRYREALQIQELIKPAALAFFEGSRPKTQPPTH